MKVEALCPHCNRRYLVEMEGLETGIPCPGCGRTFGAGRPVDIDRPASPAVPIGFSETAAVAVATEVVCPRCNLHFKPRAASRDRAKTTLGRPTVLIVEDMVYFREIAAEALSGEYAVKAVATKEAARSALEQGGIDLMVLDLTLDGGEGGLELLRELPSKTCPVLIYTAQDESEMYGDSWDELRSLGADDIVIKGLNVGDELTRKVGSMLGRSSDDDQ